MDTLRRQDARERIDLLVGRLRSPEVVPDRAHRRPHLLYRRARTHLPVHAPLPARLRNKSPTRSRPRRLKLFCLRDEPWHDVPAMTGASRRCRPNPRGRGGGGRGPGVAAWVLVGTLPRAHPPFLSAPRKAATSPRRPPSPGARPAASERETELGQALAASRG